MLKLVPPRPPPPSFVAASFDEWDVRALVQFSTHVHAHGYLQISLSAIIAVALAITTHHQVHTRPILK